MGEVELHTASHQLVVHSIFYFYGDAADEKLSGQIASDIEMVWNEPQVRVKLAGALYDVNFRIEGHYAPALHPETVWYNDDPRINFFRIEEWVTGNISFVDGIRCNTGYFKLANLLQTPTTAAHEYGHTLGLDHPRVLDIRGGREPGIMYPRGTICDPQFQYDAQAEPGATGGTLDPAHRKVSDAEIISLRLNRLAFEHGRAVIGDFSSMYHQKHVPTA